jgi:hypothetical protein
VGGVALSPATGYLSIGSFLPGFQDGRREWLRAQDTDTKWMLELQAIILLSANSWTQVRSLGFSAKAVFKNLLQYGQRTQSV